MRDVYFVHVINNCQAISAKVLRAARGRMARTPRRHPSYAAKREASDDVSPAYSFAASQGLAYEERDESQDDDVSNSVLFYFSDDPGHCLLKTRINCQ